MKLRSFWAVGFALVVAFGAYFSIRRQVLLDLKSNLGSSHRRGSLVAPLRESKAVSPFAAPVPIGLLQLRAENRALNRELAAASNQILNLTSPPTFVPRSSESMPAQANSMAALRELTRSKQYEAALALAKSLADHLARNDGQLPARLDQLQVLTSEQQQDAGYEYELIPPGEVTSEQRSLSYIARSQEISLSSGKLARIYLKADGSVVIGAMDAPADWSSWLERQLALETEGPAP